MAVMKAELRTWVALCAPFLLAAAGCATVPDQPIVDNGPASVAGTAVPVGQPVQVGPAVATPMAVQEDSRCPADAQCIRAGTVVVLTRIDGPGWRETVELALGEPHLTHGTSLMLSRVMPQRRSEAEIDPADYRFIFEAAP